ncbi:MAG: Uma2 family endonuclease [Byssovorax sp.]
MNAGTATKKGWTPAEYLAWERASPERHEFFDGDTFAIAGATFEHTKIVGNLVGELRSALRHRPCDVTPSDLRVKVPATGLYTYPDVTVLCGDPVFEDDVRDTLFNPTVLIEVLSESSEGYDRGKKFRNYRSIASFREYVLVAQDMMSIERYTRGDDGVWSLHESGAGERLVLASIGCEIAVDEIYLKVFPAAGIATTPG